MAESKMPAKIWITMEDHTASRAGAFRRWHASDLDHGDEYPVYTRADLVEPLVDALRATLCELSACSRQLTNLRCNVAKGGSVDRALVGARAALQAYEAAQ